jgi:hypothetical protein
LIAEVYLHMPSNDVPAVLRAYASDQLREVVEYEGESIGGRDSRAA